MFKTIFSTSLLFFSTLIFALPSPYFGIDGGYGYIDFKNSDSAGQYKRDSVVLGGNAGILLIKNFGVDVGYLKWGNIRQANTDFITNNYMYTLALKGILYGDEGWLFLGKAGVALANIAYHTTLTVPELTQTKINQVVPYAALGFGINISPFLTLSLMAHATLSSGNLDELKNPVTPKRMPAFYAGLLGLTFSF